MNKIIMDFGPSRANTAYVEDGILKELFVDGKEGSSLVGNIYVGIVRNIVSKQFVFIDIGREKNTFLQLNDHKEHAFLANKNINIGQHVLVQVIKDENEDKGACVTTAVSLSGRGLVLIPRDFESEKHIFLSAKIKDSRTREHLEALFEKILPPCYDVIVRTNCKSMEEKEIAAELGLLDKKYKAIMNRGIHTKGPALVYTEDFYYGKSLKSILSPNVDEIIINDEKEKENIGDILAEYHLEDKLKIYNGDIHIFDEYDLEKQIRKALNTKVWLKSGGFLIIEKTAACHVIDVNTGKFTTSKNKEKTVLKNNLEAAAEIAKQIRLRNLSGMIIIDFVDMVSEDNKKWLISHLKKELKKDRIAVNLVDISSLNLVQLTRKKTRPEISVYFMKSCPMCDGSGYISHIDYICERIYNMVNRILRQTTFNKITVSSNNKVIQYLKNMDDFNTLKSRYNADIVFDIINTGKIDYFEIAKEMKGV